MQYGLIGGRLRHSYSCEIHALIAPYEYELCELTPEEAESFFAKRSFSAVNVTIPYKEKVIPYLDIVSDKARSVGAVNTVVNKNGVLYGYNTDFDGMCDMLLFAGIEIKNKKVLILGTGGTAKTARAVCSHLGAERITNVSRTPENGEVDCLTAQNEYADTQVIINATPVGMYPDSGGMPIDISAFTCLEGIADAVYNPLRTRLVLQGQKRGIISTGGLYMLAAQAVYASALFLGKTATPDDIQKAYNGVLLQKQNLVLSGMPTSGKSSVAKVLSQKTGRPCIDTDAVITEKINCPISEYFAKYGEAEFRKIEREVIQECSKKSGCIIATGGGAVLSEMNVEALKQNGKIVFIDRSCEKLSALSDRPLASDKNALNELYIKRRKVYTETSDLTVNGDGTVSEVANLIEKAVFE